MKNEDLLMSQLLEETCKDSEKANELTESNGGDLVKYFEKRLNQVDFLSLDVYIKEEGLKSFSLNYIEKSKCFRLVCGMYELDFPSNWSVFKSLHTSNLNFVTQANDQDFLCEIFSEINSNCESFIVLNENGKCCLLMFSDYSGKLHFEWMKEYFESRGIKEDHAIAA